MSQDTMRAVSRETARPEGVEDGRSKGLAMAIQKGFLDPPVEIDVGLANQLEKLGRDGIRGGRGGGSDGGRGRRRPAV